MAEALPLEPREVDKLKRAWIADLIYSLVGMPFKKWADKVMEERTTEIREKQDLDVVLDHEVNKVFQASTSISIKSGSAAHLMKESSKRRRSKAEIKAQKKAEEKKEDDDAKLAHYEQMQAEFQQMQQ